MNAAVLVSSSCVHVGCFFGIKGLLVQSNQVTNCGKFWYVTPCSLVDRCRRLRTALMHPFLMKVEAASSTETSLICQTNCVASRCTVAGLSYDAPACFQLYPLKPSGYYMYHKV